MCEVMVLDVEWEQCFVGDFVEVVYSWNVVGCWYGQCWWYVFLYCGWMWFVWVVCFVVYGGVCDVIGDEGVIILVGDEVVFGDQLIECIQCGFV